MEYQTSSQSEETPVTWERKIWERRLLVNAEWQRRQRVRRAQAGRRAGVGGYLPAV